MEEQKNTESSVTSQVEEKDIQQPVETAKETKENPDVKQDKKKADNKKQASKKPADKKQPVKRKSHKMSMRHKRMIVGYLFILPWIVGFLIFYARSLFMLVQFSFSDLEVVAGVGGYTLKPVGLANYISAFASDPSFKQNLTTSIKDMLIDVPLVTFFSLFMAMLLNKKFPGRSVFRAIFFLPIILNSGAIKDMMELAATMMNGGISPTSTELANTAGNGALAFDMDYLINMFMLLGLPAKFVTYLSTAVTRVNTIVAASGVQIIIFIAALQSIQGSMYEVAKIEGATAYETFWKVTFPMVMPHIITNVVYTIVDKFSNSDVIEYARTKIDTYQYGLSSAFSIISTAITCLILVIIVGLLQKRTFYYN